jgi:hypothetical protein
MSCSSSVWIVVGIFAVAVFLWTQGYFKSGTNESYVSTNTEFASDTMNYDASGLDEQYKTGSHSSDDASYSAAHYADLVATGNTASEYAVQPSTPADARNPMERLTELTNSMMPKISAGVTPYNIDLANPMTHVYTMGVGPEVYVKSRIKGYDLYNFIAGDVPITYHPGYSMIEKSRFGLEDTRPKGLFSNKAIASATHHHYPIKTAGAGLADGYGGAAGEIIMDAY